MSDTITGNDNVPLFLGLAVVVIILIALFSSKKDDPPAKGGKKSKSVAPSATSSKKSKKKKSKSKVASSAPPVEKKADKKEKEVAVQEEDAPAPQAAEPDQESKAATKKKKKKSKKKASAGAASAPKSTAGGPGVSAPADENGDDSDDDDVELWRLQSAAGRKGANDAAKRAAANKERDRVRALKRQEEKKRAEAARAAVEAAAAEEEARREAEEAAALAAAEEERKRAAEAEAKAKVDAAAAAKKNGASANGELEEAAAGGEKKKRKRKKKKASPPSELAARDPLVKPAAPAAERWEVVPQVEEWQEVNTKRMKQKAKVEAAAVAAEDAATTEVYLMSDEPVDDEPGDTSVTIAAGDDPLIFIGKGGATIQYLQDTTGAKFHLDRTKNVLTISGPEDAVQHGLDEANSILAAEAERKANEAEERVTWGADAIKAVIGRGGANIRATQEATGVRIDADVEAGTLVIVGPSDQVAEALTLCHNAAFGEVQDVLELGSRNAVNLVYGPSFRTIRDLQDETGCKLDITRGSTTLKLAGSAEAVAEAIEKVRALLEANRGFEMTIEISKVGAVYGKGGETLRSIQDRTGTQIDVSRGPTHATVSVMGTEEASARARTMLQRAIDGEVELQPGEVAKEVELGSATAAVIGRGGSNVADLEKRHGVKVNVRSELQSARVVGKPEKVEAAVKEIEAIAKPILEAEAAQKKADEALESGESAWQVDPGDDDADGW